MSQNKVEMNFTGCRCGMNVSSVQMNPGLFRVGAETAELIAAASRRFYHAKY
jgi:hypothetical protein